MAGRKLKVALGVAGLAVVAGAIGFKLFRDKLVVTVPDYPPIHQAIWLDQGWTQDDRHWFHYADQGTQTLNIPYEWFIALEQPRLSIFGDVGRLSDAAYLDRYGFIPGATLGGENQLPVGFAHRQVMLTPAGEVWTNPRTLAPMSNLGFTCAACHTGRMTYQGKALLVDGGPALTDLASFRQAVGISILFTRLVPGRFERFATNVLGEGASDGAKKILRKQLDGVWKLFNAIRKLDKAVEDASVTEGFGRLDALNRIGNQVFGLDLGERGRARNYAATSAPVNFPHIWSAPWFDWVQYNASIMQPMVRNAGEALGVSAPVNLTDPKALYQPRLPILTLAEIEKRLAGEQPDEARGFSGLKAPRWPAGILPEIDEARARRGAQLYDELCKRCHLPPVGSKEFWASARWLAPNEYGQRYLHVSLVDIAQVGTDEAQAADMKARKVWSPPELKLPTDEFGGALGKLVENTVNRWYDSQTPPIPPAERPALNGFRPNGIQDPLAYKARPLNGIWATAPFLHDGAVPNVYALLSPVSERPASFYLGRREYDPVCMGYQLTAASALESNPSLRCLGDPKTPEAGAFPGGFKLDTSRRGNRNIGHEFNDGPAGGGRLDRKLQPEERLSLVEFLKTDCVTGWGPNGVGGGLASCEELMEAREK